MTQLEKKALWIVLGFYAMGWALIYFQSPSAELVLKGEAKQIQYPLDVKSVKLPPAGAEVILDSLHTESSSSQIISSNSLPKTSTSKPKSPTAKISKGSKEKIKINLADQNELQRLPGIGEGTAKKILEYKKLHGSFKKAEDLLEVKGIGEKKLNSLIPHITFES